MTRLARSLPTVLLVLGVLATPLLADDSRAAADWPQFRGPDGTGIVDAPVAPWQGDTPKVAWKRALGLGFSGISAVDGTLYTMFGAEDSEFLVALDASNGAERWRLRLDELRKDQFGDGPRSTPTIDGDRVYAVSALGHFWAVDRKTGKAVWDIPLRKTFGAAVPTWGVSAAPVIHGDLLLFDVGGEKGHGIVAFDKATGAVRWKADTGLPGYSLPITFTAAGREQTVFFTGKKLVSLVPDTGAQLWEYPWKTAYDVNAAAPIFLPPDRLFVSSGYDTGAALLRVVKKGDGLGVEEVWMSRRMKNQFSSSVELDGVIYGFDNKSLKAIQVADGEATWRKSGFGHGSLLLAGDHLVVLGDNGKLALVEATAE
ncbi:MAG: PQQ-binding-like beta-propeller repeat protein, partial [Acidobacteriota bacterium]